MNAQPKTPTVCVAIPSLDSWRADTAMSLAALSAYTSKRVPVNLALFNRKGSSISDQRNQIVKHALAERYDYILWLDADMAFPPQTLHGLLLRDKDIVGATYCRRNPPHEMLGLFTDRSVDVTKGGLVEADFLPGGTLLVKTSVYEKLGYPWYFETHRNWHGGSEVDQFLNMLDDTFNVPLPETLRSKLHALPSLREWLDRSRAATVYQTGDIMSEDNSFCKCARRAGFQLWCDLELTFRIAHISENHVMARKPVPAKILEPANA